MQPRNLTLKEHLTGRRFSNDHKVGYDVNAFSI